MKKIYLTLTILSACLTASAQTKQYQQPDPKKQYSFTFKATLGELTDLQNLTNLGLDSLSKSQIPAVNLRKATQQSGELFNNLALQLRQQVVADSLAKVKIGGKP